jgi:hypothetical protein
MKVDFQYSTDFHSDRTAIIVRQLTDMLATGISRTERVQTELAAKSDLGEFNNCAHILTNR